MKINAAAIPQELRNYLPPLTLQPDFDAFWRRSKKQLSNSINFKSEPFALPLRSIEAKKIWFTAYDGTTIAGWISYPATSDGPIPCIIHFHGYGGHKGYPSEFLAWNDLGFAVLSMDIRGQSGETGDAAGYRTGSCMSPMCQGIWNPEEYYLKHLYLDALRSIDVAVSWPEIDSSRIIVDGCSQGGALSMAVSALDNRIFACFCDVPSNSDIPQRILGGYGSFRAVQDYLRQLPNHYDTVFQVLSYFDTMNLADRITCPVFASVGLADTVCPAKCYFASYNRIPSKKEIRVYPLAGHEGGGSLRFLEKLQILQALLS